ncbi:hypothetical protein EX227_05610 [Providencia rettgeri]|uniref:Uncharacterized protein n=1 Tax=Providencia rettgeri TaxID=587 RepID=A0AAP2NXQ7_PRORE|nr:hypothetical protein [Providencia rettgeri]MBX6950171.1 hypothetical protein [Providencia rettgeri]MBX6957227.1 hypothetical protein [Providencia rettgeri]MBX6958195.1 hypothetical protein [Providencia rettgeri]MBX6972626.1 hypothetical protein [Providencia rettgeri]MBX6982640.1 hypothetical protein [Providencia rettgeri]
MGKKSREKRERRLKQKEAHSLIGEIQKNNPLFYKSKKNLSGRSTEFNKSLDATRAFLLQYNSIDIALALNVSELWPSNLGSPVKHIFAWRVLLELPIDNLPKRSIANYQDFEAFLKRLYQIWPEFPMLEDYCPEADWGQVKVKLENTFVPMFYGSCIERTPDFIEAFRITYLDDPIASTNMDICLSLQARIIESIDCVSYSAEAAARAQVEIPTEEFWLQCVASIKQIASTTWSRNLAEGLVTRVGGFNSPLTGSTFGEEVMQGEALPYVAIEIDDVLIPLSIRSGPSVVIDFWAKKDSVTPNTHSHRQLAKYVCDRFPRTLSGPITLYVGNIAEENLPISCIFPTSSTSYFVCMCNHTEYQQAEKAAQNTYTRVKQGATLKFRLANGSGFMLSKDGENGPNADEIQIIIVLTQDNTALGFIDAPQKPTRLLPLTDFVTIFDSLDEPNELDQYWQFVDANRNRLSPLSSGAADLFGSFKDTHGVLVDGATSPDMIWLDSSWGTSWRFKTLSDFWSLAPKYFPDGSSLWKLAESTTGVVTLQSRNKKLVAYSTVINNCTVQTCVEITQELNFDDGRMLDMFAQILADCLYRVNHLIPELGLFKQNYILLLCELAPNCSVNEVQAPKVGQYFDHIVVSTQQEANCENLFHVKVDTRAVLAGLQDAKDGSFEVRSLIETLKECHASCGLDMPDISNKLAELASERARYHLKVVTRHVDVPDYVDPIIPLPKNYKIARKRLATEINTLELKPGRYELADAKAKIDPAATQLRLFIESRIESLDKHQLIKGFIEQHDACLIAEKTRIMRVQQSLEHEVEYDRSEVIEEARKEFGGIARHYRYLLEKTVSSETSGAGQVSGDILRELVSLVDWFMVLAGASDILHNDIDVGGIEIDDSYLPEVFYSVDREQQDKKFAQIEAESRLGLGAKDNDVVEGASEALLSSVDLKEAFMTDLGFSLSNMLTTLVILSQAQRYGFGDSLALSYISSKSRIIQVLNENIEELEYQEAEKIVSFLTLCGKSIRRLAGRHVEEPDVPYWEHNKRIHRYAIRPLVMNGTELIWGAETASRALNIWMSAVRDGYLPADFNWPHVEKIIRNIKQGIEKQLEVRTKEIFLRYTTYVESGIDFFRKFRSERFEDVGDFDAFAYWPEKNLLITVECKYNQPPYTVKDSRRLRDKIFGKSENDKNGQISRIVRRRKFVEDNFLRLLELLNWPEPAGNVYQHIELYVSRDVYYWMVIPPYPIQTEFVAVNMLDSWLNSKLTT